MDSDQTLPAVRPLDVFPYRNERDEVYFALRDLTQVAPRPVAVSMPGYFILSHLDGRHNVRDVQAAFLKQFGQLVSEEQIREMIATLDEALLLNTDRFEQTYTRLCSQYRAADARDNRERYPPGSELRAYLENMLADGANDLESSVPLAGLRGLIVPHLDYARGARCYAAGYAALRCAPPADRYVILGTNHFGRSTSAVATTKDFLTPLGRVPTDRDFIRALERELGQSICDFQYDHNAEHSVELQVHVLQALQPDHPFEIVPLLCPDPCGTSGTQPLDGNGPDLADLADALEQLLAEAATADAPRTILIAGADLSHVGRHFGDEQPTTPEFLKQVERDDRVLLNLIESRRDDEFIDELRMSGNPTRVCSAGCIYTLLRALPDLPCHVLRYEQAINMEAETHVTCVAAVIGN